MKVIREPEPEKPMRVECRECGAVVECFLRELRFVDEPLESWHVLECPRCKHETWIGAFKW